MKQRYLPILLLFLSCASFSEDELEKSVRLFWDALANRDKASALQQVHPEDLNNFLYRSEGLLNSWELVGIEHTSETEADVVVTVNRQLKQGLVKDIRVKYRWEKTDLVARFGGMGERLWHLARGQDRRRVSAHEPVKSIQ